MNSIIIKDDRKFSFFKVKKERKDNLIILKICNEKKYISKKLMKILEKEKITGIAFERGISQKFISFFHEKINVITKEDVLFANLEKIITKACNMLGIKEAELCLGIIPGYKTDILFKKLEKVRGYLKIVYVQGDGDFSRFADVFYKETGVPVVTGRNILNKECNMFIYLNEKEISRFDYDGFVIDIFEKVCGRGIKDVKISFDNTSDQYNISDTVFAKILEKPFVIESFITKNT